MSNTYAQYVANNIFTKICQKMAHIIIHSFHLSLAQHSWDYCIHIYYIILVPNNKRNLLSVLVTKCIKPCFGENKSIYTVVSTYFVSECATVVICAHHPFNGTLFPLVIYMKLNSSQLSCVAKLQISFRQPLLHPLYLLVSQCSFEINDFQLFCLLFVLPV